MRKRFILPVVILIAIQSSVQADLRLPHVFGDNMVLQRDQPIPVWGWASPGEKITVRFHGQVQTTKAEKDSSWRVTFRSEPAGGPYTLTAQGHNQVVIQNILMGEVWIASGQSNMDFSLARAANAQEEIREADFPMIRHFKVPATLSGTPQADFPSGEWQIASPQTAADFSAVAYFFARQLYQQLHVPVGIINASWGGTVVETWISRGALEADPGFKDAFKRVSFDQIEADNRKQYEETVEELERLHGPVNAGIAAGQWKDPEMDDDSWKKMRLPVNFDEAGLSRFDGKIWFRKTVELSQDDIHSDASLNLGTIDDKDETYFNGQLIGSTDGYSLFREYTIPKALMRVGRNVIAVRVSDLLGNGGFFSKPSALQLATASHIIPLAGNWPYRIESVTRNGVDPNRYPSLLFNGMIHPLLPISLRGVIWYQGESNAPRAYQYRSSFPLLIEDWRRDFRQPDMPFYYVQIAGYNAGNGNSRTGSTWAELREAQTMALDLPNTGMAVAFDIGESADIHPRNKQDVGFRLAAIALHRLYGHPLAYAGPLFKSMKIEGNKAILSFAHADSGFQAKDPWGYIRGFEMAGPDKKFYFAKAEAIGSRILVTCDSVAVPAAVRYGWADDMPEANLYNREGFPAVPFRTDDWNTITRDQKYTVEK